MKGAQSDLQRLKHILDSISHIEQFITGINYDEYKDDFKLRLAVVKLFEIIGEAAAHVSDETKTKYPI